MTTPNPAPTTITSTLEAIWADVAYPIGLAAAEAAWPLLATIFGIPIVGPVIAFILKNTINGAMNQLISQGVISLKIDLIDSLDAAAQKKWAPQIAILKQAQGAGVLTPAQQEAYNAALQNLVENHGTIVSS